MTSETFNVYSFLYSRHIDSSSNADTVHVHAVHNHLLYVDKDIYYVSHLPLYHQLVTNYLLLLHCCRCLYCESCWKPKSDSFALVLRYMDALHCFFLEYDNNDKTGTLTSTTVTVTFSPLVIYVFV